jgi:TIR domain-containing protein
MSEPGSAAPRPAPTVFLSYASEDRPAAQTLRDALPACGLEVWYDESGLDGGDAWDQKIRRQIRECDYFLPLISANTEVRPEGYFRREWRLAVERTLDMADDHTFILPVVIDGTTQVGARVPEKFLSVQWMRLPGGQPTPAFEALCRRLVAGQPVAPQPARKRADQPSGARSQAPARAYPEFPREEPGQRMRFGFRVAGWALQSAWVFFMGVPRWLRIILYIWLGILLLSRGCTSHHSARNAADDESGPERTAADSHESRGNGDATNLGTQIARQVAQEVGTRVVGQSPLLVIPFSAAADDPAARQLADAAFAELSARVFLSHPGQVGLSKDPLSAPDLSAAVERGRARHSRYVLFGAVDKATQTLTVKMVVVADGSLMWMESYSVAGADAAQIAADLDARLPALKNN